VLITTSKRVSKYCYEFCNDILSIFPTSSFQKRDSKDTIQDIMKKENKKQKNTHIIVVNEDKKTVNAITIVTLPSGPTAHFRITNPRLTKDVSVRNLKHTIKRMRGLLE